MNTIAPSKRKRGSFGAAMLAGEDEDAAAQMSPVRLDSVVNYPRKRISVACNLCRFRKTRCNAARPSCSFCSDLGIECQYRDAAPTPAETQESPAPAPPVQKRRESPLTVDSITGLETRLKELEGQIKALQSDKQRWEGQSSTALSHPTYSSPDMSMPALHESPRSVLHRRGSHSSSVQIRNHSGFAFRQTRAEAYTARPSLLTFCCPPYVEAESWDDCAEFYTEELRAGEYFYAQFDRCLSKLPDTSNRTVRRLQQSFADNFLGWMPIFEPGAASVVVNQSCAASFVPRDLGNCLSMFILAVGAISHDSAELAGENLPGIEYFIHGCQMLERLEFLTENIDALHCRILKAAYLKLAIRPVQSWNAITGATRDCMHVLSSNLPQFSRPDMKESWNRAFWACSIIVEELEATMKMHPIGHRAFHEIVPRPRFENEDTGFYYFLAQISLRKMLLDVLDVVGYREGKVIYAPVVTSELRKQALEWYNHLPTAIRFPIDASPVFDARKSFLRAQYTSMFVVLEWASVLRVFEAYAAPDELPLSEMEEIALAKEEAQECLNYCVLYLSVAEEQLVNWKLGTHNALWTCFAFLSTLIICYRSPALAFIPETQDDKYIRSTLQLLRAWQHIPFVSRGLLRVTRNLERAGIVL